MMATLPIKSVGVDLNDPSILSVYNELLLFRADTSAVELTYQYPDPLKQKNLHSIAAGLGLDYEYWKNIRQIRISKPDAELGDTESIPIETSNLELVPPAGISRNASDNSIDLELYDLLSPLDTPTWSYEDEYQASNLSPPVNDDTLCLYSPGDLLSFNQNDMLSIFNNDIDLVSPLLPSTSFPTDAKDDFAAIFTKTSFLGSRRTSRAGSKVVSGTGSRAASRAGSTKSVTSDRERKFSKSASRNSSANRSPAFQEIVFDSKVSRPASQISRSSGRKGPLDAMARAAMKAVKALGACWRCKWMRKDCDEKSPCNRCPKGSRTSLWRCVGCRRGRLESQMHKIPLCNPPEKYEQDIGTPDLSVANLAKDSQNVKDLRKANSCLQRAVLKRAQGTVTGNGLISGEWYVDYYSTSYDSFLQNMIFRWPDLLFTRFDQISSIGHPSQLALLPLDGCIMDILWEYFDNPTLKTALGALDESSPGILLILLRAAALYQAKLPADSDRLVAQSFICLRNCFEALRVNEVVPLTNSIHSTCETEFCKVDCISNLAMSLSIYLDDLSKVFFKKENMRNKGWWLSIFYSFCIQSIIRQALIQLSSVPGLPVEIFSGAKQYLYLPLRLFNATSGLYDPLNRELSSQPTSSLQNDPLLEDFRRAKFATDQENWRAEGINSSAEYLRQLFDTDGETFLSRNSGKDSIWALRRL